MAASTLSDTDVLQDILVTLHRLEMGIKSQNNRLSTVESSLSDVSGSPVLQMGSMSSFRRCSAAEESTGYFPAPLHIMERNELATRDTSASEYMESVMKIRNRFEFDSRSELAELPQDPATQHTDTAEEIHDEANDWCTMSVYSSRPLSRLELDIPPVPSISQQESCTCGMHQMTSGLPRENLFFDDAATTGTSIGSPSFRGSLSDSEHSASTAPSTAPSTPTSKQNQEHVEHIPGIYRNLKQSLRRSISVRSKKGAPVVLEQSPTITEETPSLCEIKASESSPSILSVVKNNAKTCISTLPKFISFVTRKLVEQQLKMLDVKV